MARSVCLIVCASFRYGVLPSACLEGVAVATTEPDFNDRSKISPTTTTAFVIFHVLSVVALFYTTWQAVAVALALHWVCISWGIGMGYHRLHTHRAYTVPKAIDYLFAVCGSMTLQGGPIFWTATHRIHHQRSDKPGDPHTPRDGKWWSHMLWTIFGEEMHSNTEVMGKYAPDLMKDRFYRVLNSWHWVPLVVLGLVLLAVGGLPWLLWGVFLRVTVGLHCTWLVNSATHLWGRRRFQTTDDSRNNWWVALLTFGEGWHNNHHAYPRSARHGLVWRELDISWLQIRLLAALGIAKDLQIPTASQIANKALPLGEAA